MEGRIVPNTDIEELLATARVMMSRRDRVLSEAQERLYRELFAQTNPDGMRTGQDAARPVQEPERRRLRIGA
jgi:hypothetical protein